MLNQETIRIVKSTAPILHEHGEILTRHFYKRMFEHNPEVAPFFNPAHQQTGKQQRALADAIVAYATNIDNLEVLGAAIELIAQKHVSLMIKSEHYPIVGANLLASIREVLGEGATDAVINAWAEAYGFLADILIGREKQIYTENAKKQGGWEGFKPFRIVRKQRESSNITSFYLATVDGAPLPAFKPGQYISIRVATPDGMTTMRNYSLSDQPGQEWFRISVKREISSGMNAPAGYVSNVLHDTLVVGDLVEVAPPCGEFFLDISEKHTRPLVLLAAGIGITPIYSILLTALSSFPEREIILVHAVLNEEVQAFRSTIDTFAQEHKNLKVYYRYSDAPAMGTIREGNASSGLVTAEYLETLLSGRDADYFFCGPHLFMISIYHDLMQWGIPASQVRFEFFGPRQELERKKETVVESTKKEESAITERKESSNYVERNCDQHKFTSEVIDASHRNMAVDYSHTRHNIMPTINNGGTLTLHLPSNIIMNGFNKVQDIFMLIMLMNIFRKFYCSTYLANKIESSEIKQSIIIGHMLNMFTTNLNKKQLTKSECHSGEISNTHDQKLFQAPHMAKTNLWLFDRKNHGANLNHNRVHKYGSVDSIRTITSAVMKFIRK